MSNEYFEALDNLELFQNKMEMDEEGPIVKHWKEIIQKHESSVDADKLPWLRLCYWINFLNRNPRELPGVVFMGKNNCPLSKCELTPEKATDKMNIISRIRSVTRKAIEDNLFHELKQFVNKEVNSDYRVIYDRGIGDVLWLETPYGKINCGTVEVYLK